MTLVVVVKEEEHTMPRHPFLATIVETMTTKATIHVSGKISGKILFGRHWEDIPFSTAMMVGQEYNALITSDSGRHTVVDFN